ncbi:MAG: S8 family serine peptidase [Sporichthyaceae bacterium]
MVCFGRVRRIAVPSVVLVGLLGTPALTGTADAAGWRGKQIKDQWIVTFDKTASESQIQSAQDGVGRRGGKVGHRYKRATRGFSATMDSGAVAELRRNPHVVAVEPDVEVHAYDVQSPTPSWGLDRIDQVSLPLNSSYTYDNTGAGVTVYVIDTGIRTSHTDFGGRARSGFTSINDGRGTNDCNGHGTHVAGTVGGARYGVAKGVDLVAVRVLDCNGSGSMSGVIAGVEWVTANRSGPSVANMSLGGGAYTALDNAVANSIASGVTYAVAAGNDNTNACNQSPARTPAALTVGATTTSDARASFSNYGACLDIFAPGQGIVSAYSSSDTSTSTLSGTSMAAPHVAGAAARYLQANPGSTPSQVRSGLLGVAALNKLSGVNGSVNALLQGVGGTVAPPPPPPPPAGNAPVATVPAVSLPTAGNQHGSSTVTVTLRWSATDPDGQAISRYELQELRSGTWSSLYSGTGTAGTRAVTPGATLQWRVRATDAGGAVGEWATTSPTTVSVIQQSAATYGQNSSWSTISVSGALGGTTRRSRATGATASYTFTGTQVAYVATMARDRGMAEVFLDGVSQGVIDLYASSTQSRRIVFSTTGLTPGQHTITVKVLNTRRSSATASYVDVDAFTVLN